MINRTFEDVAEGEIGEADQQPFLGSLGWGRGSTWDDLLRSRRVLIISEAGAGKTYECRTQTIRLLAAGEPAFFLELAALATEELRSLLDADEEVRLDDWLTSQSEVATFFLDSIDELKATEKVHRKSASSGEDRYHNPANTFRRTVGQTCIAYPTGTFHGVG